MVSAKRQRFNDEFRRNLDAGNKTFDFEGTTYSTKMAPDLKRDMMPPAPKAGKIESSDLASLPQAMEGMKGRGQPDSPSVEDFNNLGERFKKIKNDVMNIKNIGNSSSPQTEAQRVGESRSDLIKQRDMIKKTQPTERTDKMFDDLRTEKDDYKTSLQQQGYKKGGAVKKVGGGAVRGGGCATKGRGKMRML